MMFPRLCCGVVRFPGEGSNCLLSSYAARCWLPLPGPGHQIKHPGGAEILHTFIVLLCIFLLESKQV